ncbi:hypothetical protein D3C80_1255290 [compost metagenome]
MHDTQLNDGFRVDRFNGLREALEAVHAGDEDVLHATILEFGHHLQPEFGAFGLGDPQTQHFLVTGHVDADSQINRLVAHGTSVTHFDVNAVQIEDRVQRVQRSGLPQLDLVTHRVGNGRDQAGRDLCAVHFLQVRLDFSDTQTARVERNDLVIEACPAGLMLGDQLRLEGGLTVARDVERQFAEVALQGFTAVTVARIGGSVGDRCAFVMPQVFGHFGFKGPLDQHLGELFEQAVFTDEVFGLFVIAQQAVGQFNQFRIRLDSFGALGFWLGHWISLG